nr:MAG TPA: hypothetical protein [Caudoviricetes sp.]DAH93876.1 MAG TPA: hypothetical protein [Caudoviricetes sp.]
MKSRELLGTPSGQSAASEWLVQRLNVKKNRLH